MADGRSKRLGRGRLYRESVSVRRRETVESSLGRSAVVAYSRNGRIVNWRRPDNRFRAGVAVINRNVRICIAYATTAGLLLVAVRLVLGDARTERITTVKYIYIPA